LVDMEKKTLDLLMEKIPAVKWSVGFPQDFAEIGEGVGAITQMDNSAKINTSNGSDRVSNVAVQIQFWAQTPERRSEAEEEVDEAMKAIGIPRSTASHFAEPRGDEALLFRFVLMYTGTYDNKTKKFYMK